MKRSHLTIFTLSLTAILTLAGGYLYIKDKNTASLQRKFEIEMQTSYENKKNNVVTLYKQRNLLIYSNLWQQNDSRLKNVIAEMSKIVETVNKNPLKSTSDFTLFEIQIEKTHQIVAFLHNFLESKSPFWKELLKIEQQIEAERKNFAQLAKELKSLDKNQLAGFRADLKLLD